MRIEEEELIPKKKKNSVMTKVIAFLIVITIIVVIAIIVVIMSVKSKEFSVVIDGQITEVSEDTFAFTEDGKIYISIRDIAPYVGYEAHKGEFKIDSEDSDKLYVEAVDETETTSFFLNSKIISKVAPNSNDDYENITIDEPIIKNNDKMYIIDTGFVVAFNSLFHYNREKNQVVIQTLPKLIESYQAKIADYGYESISEDFNNQKALIYGLIVASKKDETNFGVIDIHGNEILRPRYNKIQFVESTKEFIITNSSDKVGIAYSTGKTKIRVEYDDIKVMDSSLGLYLVNSNKKYGVINSSERSIVFIEYDQIGVDVTKFPNDNIKNQFILYDTIIPAKIDGKWRLFNISGNRLTEDEYDSLGYIAENSSSKVDGNTLMIGDTEAIVVGKRDSYGEGEVYGAVDIKGNELIPIVFEKIYSTTEAGNTNYFILHQGKNYSAKEYIDIRKQQLGYTKNEDDKVNTQPTGDQNTTNTVVDNGSGSNNTTVDENVVNNNVTNEVADGNTAQPSAEPTEQNNAIPHEEQQV